jgi:tetratricopeptide (TPR) repeat protein
MWVCGLVAAASLAALGLVAADWYVALPEDAQPQYVGRGACIECHQAQHAAYEGSHHDLAMDRATEATVLGDFHDAELEHHGIRARMFRRDGKFFVHTEGPDGQMADFEVKYVFGVDPLQQYLVEFDRPADMPPHEVARLQVLRWSWDTRNKRWFHLDPPDVKERLDPSDELHWTGLAQRWNTMCADCHSTNLQRNYDVQRGQYRTTWSEIDVSCEACHGPGSLHVQLARAKWFFWDRRRGYALARLKDASNWPQVQACAPCHSRRRVLAEGYQAGCNYYDYFANELLGAGTYHADGQILDEVYELGSFVQSKMFHKNIRCTDCHDPHSLKLRHTGNQVCTSCHQHPAGKYDGAIHHRHADGSPGAQCVNCHMPSTTYMELDPRRDHSLRVPRPDLSVQLGTPNACTGCHLRDAVLPGVAGGSTPADKAAWQQRDDLKEYADWLAAARRGDEVARARLAEVDRWADATLARWYGPQRRLEKHFATALHAAREMRTGADAALRELLADRQQPAIARATAALELVAWLEGSRDNHAALRGALADRDPQVRAAAVLALAQDASPPVVSALAKLLGDPTRLVRTEAARALAQSGGASQLGPDERAAFHRALTECLAAAEADRDRAAGHLTLGILYESLGQLEQAEEAYRTAIRVEPRSIGPRTNLAALYDRRWQQAQQQALRLVQAGQRPQAEQALAALGALPLWIQQLREEELALLERDALLAPDNAVIQGRLGLARYLGGWGKEAEAALRTAALLAPRDPEHLFRLAIYYRDTGRPQWAAELARRLVALRPHSPTFAQLAAELAAGPTPSDRP